MAWHDELSYEKARHEAAIIVRAFAERGIDIGGVASPGGGVAFMYAKDQFLAREQYLGEVGVDRGGRLFRTPTGEEAYWTYSGTTVSRMLRSGESSGTSWSSSLHPDREEREQRDARFLLERINEEFGAANRDA